MAQGFTNQNLEGIYALLGGRSGGQTLNGGTAASEKLVLHSTSDGTKGDIDLNIADLTFLSTSRARMASQNRFRYLNTGAHVRLLSGNQTISNNSRTIMLFDSENFDTDTIHSTSSNTGRLTAQITGKYLATCSILWTANATGSRIVSIKKNGTTLVSEHSQQNVTGNGLMVTGSPCIIALTAADYIEVEVFQDSGGDLQVALDPRTQFAMMYVGE